MRRALAAVVFCAMLSSCETSSLYYWGGTSNGATTYEHLAYKTYDKQTAESLCKLIVAYEDMVKHPAGTRQVPPPGICAEYGYMLLLPETADAFARAATKSQRRMFEGSDYGMVFKQRGEEMLKMEMELYPESAIFLAPLIKRFTK